MAEDLPKKNYINSQKNINNNFLKNDCFKT